MTEPEKKKNPSTTIWTNSELYDIAIGLQKYGFSEKEKIAETIKTKEKDVAMSYLRTAEESLKRKYLAKKRKKAKNSRCKGASLRNSSIFSTPLPEEVEKWPTIRKWNWLARKEQLSGQRLDYSQKVMENLIEDFWKEAEEPENPQMIDVKSIYKFLYDCVTGKCPTELMPKESGVVLMLLKKLKELQDSMDLDEEKKFISSYKEPVKFAPMDKNVEILRKLKRENMDYYKKLSADPNAVKIPNELYSLLDLHQRLVQSFNPFNVPLWFLNKEQASIAHLMQDTQGCNSRPSNLESNS